MAKRWKIRLRRYLIAGVLIWVPAGVTFLILRLVVDLMDRSLLWLPTALRPENVVGFRIPGLGVLLTVTLLLVTGFFAANLIGRRLVALWEWTLSRIPLVNYVYSGAKQIAEALFSDRRQAFRKVLLVEYPRRGAWSLAFLTSSKPGEAQAKIGKEVLCIFVPTTPNPTSGFLIMVPKEDVVELDMAVEEAFRMLISLGVLVPEWPRANPTIPSKRATSEIST